MLQVEKVSKVYEGKIAYEALTNINLAIEKGEFVGVMGPSGSGKTTLLNLIATIDEPTTGQILIEGNNPYQLNPNDLAKFRRQALGYEKVNNIDEKAVRIAHTLYILLRMDKRTFEISGGQAQRAAIACSIIYQPKLLLADELTGNLDSKASKDVMEMLLALNKNEQATTLLVTHDPQAASYCDRIVFIRDGKFFSEIHKGNNQKTFFQKIIDTLSCLGGNDHDFSSIRD